MEYISFTLMLVFFLFVKYFSTRDLALNINFECGFCKKILDPVSAFEKSFFCCYSVKNNLKILKFSLNT